MKIIAKAQKGKEFFYSIKSAAFAPNASAEKIARALNESRYKLNEGEVWHIYEPQWDDKYRIEKQFYIYRGVIKLKWVY